MTELEDGDDVFLRTDDKIYLQCTRTHENKQGTVSTKHYGQIWDRKSDESERSKAGKIFGHSDNGRPLTARCQLAFQIGVFLLGYNENRFHDVMQ